jgi:hypothetical protein
MPTRTHTGDVVPPPLERLYVVQPTLSRAGRVPELSVNAADAASLARQVHRYVSKWIISSDFTVHVDLDAGQGWIGGGRYGTFTIEDRGDFAQHPVDRDPPKAKVKSAPGGDHCYFVEIGGTVVGEVARLGSLPSMQRWVAYPHEGLPPRPNNFRTRKAAVDVLVAAATRRESA